MLPIGNVHRDFETETDLGSSRGLPFHGGHGDYSCVKIQKTRSAGPGSLYRAGCRHRTQYARADAPVASTGSGFGPHDFPESSFPAAQVGLRVSNRAQIQPPFPFSPRPL